ncbi:hypothetical protein AGMMS50262_05160 [Bacteroidia bacterium]|nr:hypothetical protein AGMMS50262_05160 [Bacteroidia bacterium]
MSLESYIHGHRRGNAVNRLEREAMSDAFLADAMEGYDTFKGNQAIQVKELQQQFSRQTPTANINFLKISLILLVILLLGGVGAYFYLNPVSFSLKTETPIENNQPTVSLPADTLIIEDTTTLSVDTLPKRRVVKTETLDTFIQLQIPKPSEKIDSLALSF